MACEKAQLLALLLKLEEDMSQACRDRGQTDPCRRVLAPLRALRARVEELAASEVEASIWD